MNIKEAAAASGLSADTIRYYERRGVLPSPPRQANGYREYTPDHLETLRLANGLRELSLPLGDIAAILPVAHEGTCRELRGTLVETLEAAVSQLEARLRELRRTKRNLKTLLDGLRRMRARATRVPGLSACECAQLVSARPSRRTPAARRRP